jgi:hypothetical protein
MNLKELGKFVSGTSEPLKLPKVPKAERMVKRGKAILKCTEVTL